MNVAATFLREPLRAPVTLALLIVVPVLFIVSAANALSDFALALGGSLARDAAIGLSAGWAAAFLAGALGFFQASSSRTADRRLALAGKGVVRVAVSRLTASVLLALLASAVAFATLAVRVNLAHPVHAAVGITAFAVIYLGIGIAIGSLMTAPLEGSLLVVFVFLLDIFAGPAMTGTTKPWAISHEAAEALIAAGMGTNTSTADWMRLSLFVLASLALAVGVFALSARSRT